MTTAPLFADHALSARLESADARLLVLCHAAVVEHLPERPSALLEVGGGVAPFLGPRISLSRAAGLGMNGPVTDADLDALEDFYRQRGEGVDLLLSPYADPSLFEGLGARGFRLVELDTVLAQRLDATDCSAAPAGEITVRAMRSDERAAWVAASLAGFVGVDDNVAGEMNATFEAISHVPTSTYLFASIDGAVAGTAAVDVQSGAANLIAASTLPGARRRGVQAALLRARLDLARAAGCDLAFTRTAPGGPSQRNAERQGFRTMYSRARLSKRLT